jgi:CheY-like chemotaxis protein/ribonuclease BN (tRNA processing enzyme)
VQGNLLITHTHWDHIQGFPFFTPLFIPGNQWDVYAPRGLGSKLEDVLAGQMEYTYFPVTIQQLGATMAYHDLIEGGFNLDNVCVHARYLNHPAPTLGYRLEVGGAVMVYAADHEPHSQHVHELTGLPVHHEDLRHIEFLSGADLVIHDAQYTADEYAKKVGWGHTSMEKAVEFAMAAGAKMLAIFHHDPLRDDDTLARLIDEHRRFVAARGSDLEVFAAVEGQTIELPEHEVVAPNASQSALVVQTGLTEALQTSEATVLVVDNEPDTVSQIDAILRLKGFHVLTAHDGKSALDIARAERPDLILTDWETPLCSGLDLCRALRVDEDPKLRNIPVILITGYPRQAEDIAIAFGAGITDYLTKPFSLQNMRSRVEAWLLRSRKPTSDAS